MLITEHTTQGRSSNEAASPSLLFSTVDLVRACCAHEQYDTWMALHGLPLGSAGIAHYWDAPPRSLRNKPMPFRSRRSRLMNMQHGKPSLIF